MLTLVSVISALSVVAIMLLPLVLVSNLIFGLSQKIFVSLIFSIHMISVAELYTRQDEYGYSGWMAVKDFDFTYTSLASMYFPFFIFIIFFLLSTIFINLITVFFKSNNLRNANYRIGILRVIRLLRMNLSKSFTRTNKNYLPWILLIGIVQVAASFFMFYNGAGIVGVIGEALPFKAIGISYLISKVLVPITLAFIFMKSNQGGLAYIYILIVALISGSAHLSRSTFLATLLLPSIIVFLSPKRYLLKASGILIILFGLYHIVQERGLVYSYLNEFRMLEYVPVKEWFLVFFESMSSNFLTPGIMFFAEIISRISSSQGIILGNQFNLELVGGGFEIFKGLIFHSLQTIDQDQYFMAWMGADLPPGFAHGGGFMSLMMALWWHNKVLFFVSATYIALWCKFIDLISSRFAIMGQVTLILTTFLSVIILIMWVGNLSFYLYLLFLITISIVLRVRLK